MIPNLKRHKSGYYYIHWMDGRRTLQMSTRYRDETRATIFLGKFILGDWMQMIIKNATVPPEREPSDVTPRGT